ncbi:hypothetical protein QVD17_26416 [Tagetes erecta]|uniref:F-box domain-containing protein n=1 Tax=Tagetes erecta TaxID=13708 RepID=A0AAD8K6I9_TARER|nr:hypothetical protein QVD17_26416 [Tagetes erecta]
MGNNLSVTTILNELNDDFLWVVFQHFDLPELFGAREHSQRFEELVNDNRFITRYNNERGGSLWTFTHFYHTHVPHNHRIVGHRAEDHRRFTYYLTDFGVNLGNSADYIQLIGGFRSALVFWYARIVVTSITAHQNDLPDDFIIGSVLEIQCRTQRNNLDIYPLSSRASASPPQDKWTPRRKSEKDYLLPEAVGVDLDNQEGNIQWIGAAFRSLEMLRFKRKPPPPHVLSLEHELFTEASLPYSADISSPGQTTST